jgi:hypothetical protein
MGLNGAINAVYVRIFALRDSTSEMVFDANGSIVIHA